MPYGNDPSIEPSGGYGKDPAASSDTEKPLDMGISGTLQATERGFLSSTLGGLGEVEKAVRAPFGIAAKAAGVPEQYVKSIEKPYLPTTETFENILPGKELEKRHKTAQTVGEFLPAILPLGEAATAKVASELPKVVEVAKAAMPYSGTKAIAAVKDIGPPTDVSVLGDKMSKTLTERFNKLWAERSKEETLLREAYLKREETAPFIGQEIARRYDQYLTSINPRTLHSDEAKIIQATRQEIGDKPTLEKLVKERRHLDDIANSGKFEGYSAITKSMAGQLRNALTKSIEDLVPEYRQYREVYGQKSDPINLFTETTAGKRVVTEASDKLPDEVLKYDPAILPKTFFKTKQTVENLRQISGGNEKFVVDSAKEYAASELDKATRQKNIGKAAEAARNWLNNNEIWLEAVPDVQKASEAYVANLERTATVHRVRNYAALGASGALGLHYGEYALRRALGF